MSHRLAYTGGHGTVWVEVPWDDGFPLWPPSTLEFKDMRSGDVHSFMYQGPGMHGPGLIATQAAPVREHPEPDDIVVEAELVDDPPKELERG